MTRDEALDRQYEISVTAGMNQRYDLYFISKYERLEFVTKVTTAALAVLSTVFSVVGCFDSGSWAVYPGAALSVLTTIGAWILNLAPFSEKEMQHRELFRRWSGLRIEADALEWEIRDDNVDKALVEKLRELDTKLRLICADQPEDTDLDFLTQCQKTEEDSRRAAEPPRRTDDREKERLARMAASPL